jgi:hypothetical protein
MLRLTSASAAQQSDAFKQQFQTEYEAWRNGIQAGQPAQYEASVNSILDKWWAFTNQLSAQVESDQDGTSSTVADLVKDLETQKQVLAELESEAGTRGDQADSVNPKSKPSPYTNILGLQRTFRESTRSNIFVATLVFAALALVAVAALVFSVVTGGQVFKAPLLAGPSMISAAAGGGRNRGH